MANALGRKINMGEIVVLRKKLFKLEYQELKFRLFRCSGGFGMSDETMGRAIYGEFLSDGEVCRYNGEDIDAKETIEYQKEN